MRRTGVSHQHTIVRVKPWQLIWQNTFLLKALDERDTNLGIGRLIHLRVGILGLPKETNVAECIERGTRFAATDFALLAAKTAGGLLVALGWAVNAPGHEATAVVAWALQTCE